MNYEIGQTFDRFSDDVAEWSRNNDAALIFNAEKQVYEIVPNEKSEEEKAAEALIRAKIERAAAVDALTVEVDGMTFDGNEEAQSRMTRALEVAKITGMESTVWVLADNTVAEVTVTQMQRALTKAMLAMGELWVKPYADTPTTLEEKHERK